MDEPYKKRELDHYFGDLNKRLDKQDTQLESIRVQTTATNGRVNKLEWWQKAVIWAVGAAWAFMLVILPLGVMIFRHELERTVNDIIDKKWVALTNQYDLQIKLEQ